MCREWDRDLPSLAGAMRVMVNRFTGFSANMLMLGGGEAATPVTLPLPSSEGAYVGALIVPCGGKGISKGTLEAEGIQTS